MAPRPLNSAIAKLARAEEHLRCLDEQIGRWRKQVPTPLPTEHNDESTEFRFYVQYDPAPQPVTWSLIMGDCIHNLRSALDHVVYELSGGVNAPIGIEFPVILDMSYMILPESDRRSYRYKIRGIKEDVIRTIIYLAQPWRRRERPQDDPLWRLQQLDINDKHRLLRPIINPITQRNGEANILWDNSVIAATFEIIIPEVIELKKKTLFATVRTSQPAKDVAMNLNTTGAVAIRLTDESDDPILGGVTTTLRELCKYTRGLVEQIRDALIQPVDPPPA
jgi:hypothetical protein